MRRFGVVPTGLLVSSVTVLLALVLPLAVQGQSQFGQITGLVTDAAGNRVVGASVAITSESTGVSVTTETNSAGSYSETSLVPGTYTVAVSKSGFGTITRKEIVLQVSQAAEIDFKLQVGQVHQEVTVKASGGLLQTQNAVVGTVVPQSGVINLPLNGRNYLQLATLVPGVNSAGLSQTFFNMPTNNLVINGLRQSATAYVIDGANVMMQFTSGTPYTPAPDAIQEFKIDTNNMTAEFGGGGSIVNVVLKSGADQFHGDLYDFLRNDALDAKNYFALTTPKLRYNQFGASLGGPIMRRKLFFFSDYQGTRIEQGVTNNVVVPTALERQGNFSGLPQINDPYTGQALAGNQIPPSAVSPQAQFFLKFFPDANTSSGTYTSNGNGTNSANQYDLRFDAHVRSSDLIAFTWSQLFTSNTSPGPLPLNGASSGPSQGEFTNLNWTHTFGPNVTNQANYSYARVTATTTGQGIGTNYTVQSGIGGFADTSIDYPGPPDLSISGFAGIDGYPFLPLGQTYNHYDFIDALTAVVGKHTLQFGGNARWVEEFNYNGAWSRGSFGFTGTYTGNAFADFLYGVPFSGERGFPRNLFGGRQTIQAIYAQDTWRATPNLTLIGGLRWDVIHPTMFMHNMAASVDLADNKIIVASNSQGQINTTTQQVTKIVLPLFQSMIVPSSQVGLPPSLVFMNWRNFAPRLGVAYQIPSWNAVVRAGYGIFYPLIQGNQAVSTPGANAPFIVDQPEVNTTPTPTATLATMFPPTTPGNFALGPILNNSNDPHMPSQSIQEWNTAIQKRFGQIASFQIAYVGSKGTHIPFLNVANVPLPGPGSIQARRLNPSFGEGFHLSAIGISNYNSLQATAQTLSWHGLFALASYTWAKAMDNQTADNNNGSSVQNPDDIKAEYGVADSNLARRFTLGLTYELPGLADHGILVRKALGGWELSSIVTVQTGPVFTPTLNTDPANTGTTARPNQSRNANLSNPNIHHWFDVSAFPVPAPFTFGNAERNTVTGPPLRDWDLGVHKDLVLSHFTGGEQRLQFRGEIFNFTNTPPFGLPDAGIQDATAGQVFTAGNPRVAQIALKLLF
jgi:hypothetical protein